MPFAQGTGEGSVSVYVMWPVQALTYRGYAPSVAAGTSNANATPGTQTLTITTYAPTARQADKTLEEVLTSFDADYQVTLFEVDATSVGGPLLRFFSGIAANDQPVYWQGNQYVPYPIEADGFEMKVKDAMPRPKLRAANVNHTFTSLLETADDLVGCTVRRWRTFKRFLDGQPSADPTKHLAVDDYVIERKITQNPIYIEWELSAWLDQQGVMLPKRQVLRDFCPWVYRYWDGTQFKYDKVTCPYTVEQSGAYFDEQGNACTPDQDRCGKRLSDCKKRYGNNPLPFGGFPGVSRVRY